MNKLTELVSVVVVTRNRRIELTRCLQSLQKSTYKRLEIIVVDNKSVTPVSSWVKKIFPHYKIIRSETNLGAAGGRNLGIKFTSGNFLLFMDDDAKADTKMIEQLLAVLKQSRKIGIVQPKIYNIEEKNTLQGIGCNINSFTGRISSLGIREIDHGQYDNTREIPTVGCIWMVRKEIISEVGNYDEDYFIPYEDLDFSFRVRYKGYKIYFVSKAKAWHSGVKSTFMSKGLDYIGIRDTDRAYRIAKNKIIFMKKHASFLKFTLFLLIFLPIYTIIHSIIILSSLKINLLIDYWKGVISGLIHVMKLKDIYYKFDNFINPFKIFILSWEDPVCWIIDKTAVSILDVGCGQGFPMRMIKSRMRVIKSMGVDLFNPYIEEGKRLKVHDKYTKVDVRKIKFQNRSFDVVLALQIIEHLNKKDAWKLVEKIEKIARKQVIITTPIGKTYHPAVDNNKLQLHKSGFFPKEFEIRGYKIIKFSRKEILGEKGLVHRIDNDIFRKIIYSLSCLLNILLYLFQPLANYYFVAYKKIK